MWTAATSGSTSTSTSTATSSPAPSGFSLPNNQANVGIGMLSSALKKKKVRLKSKLQEIIHEHPIEKR